MTSGNAGPLARRAPISVVMFLLLAPVAFAGQQADGPTTAWGHPDLQGVWNNNTNVPLERPDTVAGRATLTDEEVANDDKRAPTRCSRQAKATPASTTSSGSNTVWTRTARR